MNAKHLFLTLTMLLASFTFAWGTEYVDVISYTEIHDNYSTQITSDPNVNTMSGCTFESDAEYEGYLFYSSTESKIGIFNRVFGTSASGGVVKSVTVHFHSSTASGHGVELCVGNTAFASGDSKATAEGKSSETHTISYDGTNTSVTYSSFSGDYEYIALAGIFSGKGVKSTYVTSVEIVWEKAVPHTITKGAITGTGFADWDADISVNKSTAVKDELVTVTITPTDYFSSAVSCTINDMVFDFACFGYVGAEETFTIPFYMPDEDVTITAVFDEVWKDSQDISVSSYNVTVQSGVESVITFERYESVGHTPVTEGKASYTIADASIADIAIVDKGDGTGTCTITGKKVGTTTFTIEAPKTTDFEAGSSSKITVIVTPRDIALVAQYGDEFYAMKNTFADGHAAGVQVFYSDAEKKYYYLDGTNLSQLTWHGADPAKKNFHIQNPVHSDKYLMWEAGSLDESTDSYNWWKNGEQKFINNDEWGIAYNGSVFQASKSMTSAAIEALISNFSVLTYSTAAGAGIVDARSLTTGSKGTICVPFDVTDLKDAGADFFDFTGKILNSKGDALAGIVISEKLTTLEAGHSYFFQMQDGKSAITLTGANTFVTIAEKLGDDGFVGCLPGDGEKLYVPSGTSEYATRDRIDGCYGLSGGLLRYVQPGATASAKQYRAYIDAKELPVVKASSAPRRRVILSSDYDESIEFGTDDDPLQTGIDELKEATFINWNEPVYNIMGVQVGKGAKGVLIQNGQKFLAQ